MFQSIAATISSLFKGNKAELERHFVVQLADGGSTWTMSLTPRDSTISSVLTAIEIGGALSGRDCSFDTMTITEQGGSVIVYTFTDKVYKETLSNDEKAYFTVQ